MWGKSRNSRAYSILFLLIELNSERPPSLLEVEPTRPPRRSESDVGQVPDRDSLSLPGGMGLASEYKLRAFLQLRFPAACGGKLQFSSALNAFLTSNLGFVKHINYCRRSLFADQRKMFTFIKFNPPTQEVPWDRVRSIRHIR